MISFSHLMEYDTATEIVIKTMQMCFHIIITIKYF